MNVEIGDQVFVKEISYNFKDMECETRHVPATVIAVHYNKISVRFPNGIFRDLSVGWFRKEKP